MPNTEDLRSELEKWRERSGKIVHVRVMSATNYLADIIEVQMEILEDGEVFTAEITM